MRKGLIATAVAVALFAVGAFAASFAVSSEDTASGSDAVSPCADNVVIDFNETYSTTSQNWNIASIDVTFTGTNLQACINRAADATLVLQNNGTTKVFEDTKTLDDSLNFVPSADTGTSPLPVADVWNAAVLIDGVQLNVAP
jgi:ABC-type phosphate transport system substrate-binding protein